MEDYSKWTADKLKKEFKRLRELKPITGGEIADVCFQIRAISGELKTRKWVEQREQDKAERTKRTILWAASEARARIEQLAWLEDIVWNKYKERDNEIKGLIEGISLDDINSHIRSKTLINAGVALWFRKHLDCIKE